MAWILTLGGAYELVVIPKEKANKIEGFRSVVGAKTDQSPSDSPSLQGTQTELLHPYSAHLQISHQILFKSDVQTK